jgi:hypothetical protein
MMTTETVARSAAETAASQDALAVLEQMFGYYEPLATAPVAVADDYDEYALAGPSLPLAGLPARLSGRAFVFPGLRLAGPPVPISLRQCVTFAPPQGLSPDPVMA